MANKIATREAYGKTLAKLAEEVENIVVLDADLSKSTKTADFKKVAEDRFFNMGIAEGNMMGVAAGLSTCGKIPFVSTFAMFAAGRAFEQIRNSICYPNLNVKVCATHAGLTVGEDGASHQAIEDLSLMRSNDVTIVAIGIMVDVALEAKEMLAKEGINARVINIHTLKPIDKEIILKAARETGAIVTVEEHSIIGGLGSAVSEVVCEERPVPVIRIGVNDKFGESGKPDELLRAYGLTSENVVSACKKVIG